MQCVQCDAEMEYFEKSESTNWLESHWRCPDCDYTEDSKNRVDVNILK